MTGFSNQLFNMVIYTNIETVATDKLGTENLYFKNGIILFIRLSVWFLV